MLKWAVVRSSLRAIPKGCVTWSHRHVLQLWPVKSDVTMEQGTYFGLVCKQILCVMDTEVS